MSKSQRRDLHFKFSTESVQNSPECLSLINYDFNSYTKHIARMPKPSTMHVCDYFVKIAKWPLARVQVATSSKCPSKCMNCLPTSYTSFHSTVPSWKSYSTLVKSSWWVWSYPHHQKCIFLLIQNLNTWPTSTIMEPTHHIFMPWQNFCKNVKWSLARVQVATSWKFILEHMVGIPIICTSCWCTHIMKYHHQSLQITSFAKVRVCNTKIA